MGKRKLTQFQRLQARLRFAHLHAIATEKESTRKLNQLLRRRHKKIIKDLERKDIDPADAPRTLRKQLRIIERKFESEAKNVYNDISGNAVDVHAVGLARFEQIVNEEFDVEFDKVAVLVNKRTVDSINAETFKQLAKHDVLVTQRVSSVIKTGIALGETSDKIARNIRKVAKLSRNEAKKVA